MYLAAQILGLVALILTVISFFAKKRSVFIAFNLSMNLVLGTQYFLLNEKTSGFLCLFASLRYVVYMLKNKNKLFSGIWIPIIFVCANLIISILTFENWYDILPTISAITLCITPWFENVKVLKIGSLSVCPLWFVFDILVKAWTALLMEVVSFVVTLTIFIISLIKEKQTEKNLEKQSEKNISIEKVN